MSKDVVFVSKRLSLLLRSRDWTHLFKWFPPVIDSLFVFLGTWLICVLRLCSRCFMAHFFSWVIADCMDVVIGRSWCNCNLFLFVKSSCIVVNFEHEDVEESRQNSADDTISGDDPFFRRMFFTWTGVVFRNTLINVHVCTTCSRNDAINTPLETLRWTDSFVVSAFFALSALPTTRPTCCGTWW